MPYLSNAPLVLIWRRVLDLPAAKRNVQRVNGWPRVGEDDYSAMYDAGNVLVAYWNQAEFLTREREPAARDVSRKTTATTEREPAATDTEVAASSTCSDENLKARSAAFNPSNQLTLVVEDSGRVAQLLNSLAGQEVRPAESVEKIGSAISFVDDVGNTTRYLRLSPAGNGGSLRSRLKALRDSGVGGLQRFHPVIGYELLVSNLEKSRKFYGDILGLRTHDTEPDKVVLDTGNLFLTLKQEPSVGLVRNVRKARKLGDDLIVFYTDEVEKMVFDLSARGVAFPKGIEDSSHGRVAVFEDPDGHTFSVWQPPARTGKLDIDYFPVLDRLLASAMAQESYSS